jgi:plastocyanin
MTRLLAVVLMAVTVLTVAACGDDDDDDGGDATQAATGTESADGGGGASEVTIADFAFAPADIEVAVGDTVTWTNEDSAPHTATADDDSFDTGQLGQGDSGEATFDEAGEFAYACSIHPDMTGTVTVSE